MAASSSPGNKNKSQNKTKQDQVSEYVSKTKKQVWSVLMMCQFKTAVVLLTTGCPSVLKSKSDSHHQMDMAYLTRQVWSACNNDDCVYLWTRMAIYRARDQSPASDVTWYGLDVARYGWRGGQRPDTPPRLLCWYLKWTSSLSCRCIGCIVVGSRIVPKHVSNKKTKWKKKNIL